METLQVKKPSKQLLPLGEAGLAKIRQICEEHQCAHVNGLLVDGYTAACIITVWDRISAENQARLLKLSISKVAHICFDLVAGK